MDTISNILRSQTVLGTLRENREVELKLKEHWHDLLGDLAFDIQLKYVRNKQVYVDSKNPLWVRELDFFKPMIIQRMNQCISKKWVVDLKVSVQVEEKKETPKKVSYEGLPLSDQISALNKDKKKQGLRLCQNCNKMYVSKGFCLFCLNEKFN